MINIVYYPVNSITGLLNFFVSIVIFLINTIFLIHLFIVITVTSNLQNIHKNTKYVYNNEKFESA